MIKPTQINVDMEKATKKWKAIVEKLGITNPEKIESMCEYAELHASALTAGMIKENVAYANSSNTAGMGAVVMPGLSGTAGLPGTAGSGDLGQTLLPGSLKIAAMTMGLELVPTINVNSNRVDLLYFDFTYNDTPGFDGDERASTFKMAVSDATEAATLAAFLRAEMVLAGSVELRGRISVPMYFHFSGSATSSTFPAEVGEPYVVTTAPTGTKFGWFQFMGFSRIDGQPMFKGWVQSNTASSGNWTEDQTLNSLPILGTLTTILADAAIDKPSNGTTNQDLGTAVTPSLVSLNEDFIDGFTTGGGNKAMTRGTWETDEAGKIGPNSFVKSVEIGVAHVSAALRLSEIGDYKRMYGIDIVQRTQAQLINQISQQISIEIVEKVKSMGLQNRSTAPAFTAGTWTGVTNSTIFDLSVTNVATALGGEHNASIARKLWAKVTSASYYIASDGRIGGAEYMICSGMVAGILKSIQGYTINPFDAKLAGPGQLTPAGSVEGLKIYVDPYMSPSDLTIYLGRVGKKEEPGIKFLAYMLAESVEITSERTMGPRLYLYSRYALCEFGFFPQKQYMAIKISDPNGILF